VALKGAQAMLSKTQILSSETNSETV
jgi:hypothetical protein